MDKLEKVMGVKSEVSGANLFYTCKACGKVWSPDAGSDSDGERMLKMLCPEGCNKPEGYDEEVDALLNQWIEDHEEDFQEYLALSKKRDGKEHLEDDEDGADYVAEVRAEWESETLEERGSFIDEGLAEWLERE